VRDVEAQLIHDMQNTATVLREAASQLHRNRETLPQGVVEHLIEMMDRRSEMLVRLLGDLSTSHLAERGELDLSLQRVSLPEICRDLLEERQPVVGPAHITLDIADNQRAEVRRPQRRGERRTPGCPRPARRQR
jgi:signal transduction histidine kinase